MLRGVLGYTLFCLGGATLAFTGGRYALGEWRQARARQSWNEAEARAVVALARRTASVDRRIPGVIMAGIPVARLNIPRLDLDEIVFEGVDDEALNAGPGHLPGSAFPGEPGNAVISGHRDRHFTRLGDIRVGDTLVTESGMHHGRWVVIAKRVVDADMPALFRSSTPTLTLTTCWPIRYVGTAPMRLLVTAKPIPATDSFASAARD
ncbi:MAG TPA: class D sortase [Gemmatimonadaceae bacterium]|nr:class D sortase [Gemmatimonadaceae bacterium]